MTIALSILPILLTIVCGYILVVSRVLPAERWDGIEVLSFRLLIPVIIIKVIANSELSFDKFGPMVIYIILSLTLAGLLVFALRLFIKRKQLPDPTFTTLFQTTTRWNAFLALAAAELLLGPEGLPLIALAIACLIPFINIVNIGVLAIFGPGQTNVGNIALILIKNPLIQGCLIGLAVNLSGVTLPEPLLQTLDLIGRGAIGVGLLAVGAGIDLGRLLKFSPLVWLGIILRQGLCPGLFLVFAKSSALGPTQTLAGVLVLIVPAASNGYIIAKQMGGDAELYADILVWQTLLSMFLLPALAILLTTS